MICANCTESLPEDALVCPHCGNEPSLAGAYRLLDVVGSGAHGTTYRAQRLGDGAVVAIKELLIRKVDSLKAIELFEREARVLEELEHPGIVGYHDELHIDAGRSHALYLVQDFVEGRTLAEEFAERRGTPEEVFTIAAELLDTLDYMHELSPPVIHRDIKPSNVMRRKDGQLVLIDFGSVRDAIDTTEGGSTVAGTFGYMAPEQFMGRAVPGTDIYGVGATIVALLSRRDPQDLLAADRSIDWRKHLSLPCGLSRILGRMLEPDVARRPSDASVLAEAIRCALDGRESFADDAGLAELSAVPSPPRPLPAKFRKTYAPHTTFHLMFGGIFVVAGLLAGVVTVAVSFATGAWWTLLLSVVFLATFCGVGGATMATGLRAISRARRAYEEGISTSAVVVSQTLSNYSVNGRRADVYTYEFYVSDQIHSGTFETFDAMRLSIGQKVTVLYHPDDPEANLLYQPASYDARDRLRADLRASLRDDVELDFGASEEAAVEVSSRRSD